MTPPARSGPIANLVRNRHIRAVVGRAAAFLGGIGRRGRPREHVLVAPPGDRNIGDQALAEAFLENVAGPVAILTRLPGDIRVPEGFRDRVRIIAMPSLVYGRFTGHARDMLRFSRLLATAASFSVVGADVMDGAYVLGASQTRARLCEIAARRGIPTRVLGFSWNATPAAAAVRSLRAAEHRGTRLLLRDPVSEGRARRDGLDPVLSADMVFAASSVSETLVEELGGRLGPTAPLALVNASGLVGSSGGLLDEYVAAVTGLRAAGWDVVLVPHVSRPGSDDVPMCAAIAERAGPGVVLLERLGTPAEIRGLARRARLVVTGRMHLAVMALMSGVPAFTIATQGKVEGLMVSLDSPGLALPPGPGLADRVLGDLERLDEYRERIARALPEVRRRALLNFDGLPGLSVVPAPSD